MTTEPVRLERRAGQRFQVSLPLSVHSDGKTFPGCTQDVSGRGIFFYSEVALPEGAMLELTFVMPSEITLAESMRVCCRGRVLRNSTAKDARKIGIAVRFDSYQYLSSSGQEPAREFLRVSGNSSASGNPRPWTR